MINQLDNGLDLNFETDPEERKRRLAMMSGLITGNVKDLSGPVMQPTAGPIQPPMMPDETQAETQRLQQQNQLTQGVPTQQTPMAPVVPEQPQPTTVQTKAVGAAQTQPINPNEQKPELPPMPTIGEGVQVAGPMVTPPAPVPQWSQDLTNAQGDMTKLHAIAGNPQYPEEARRLAGELTAKQYKQMNNEKEATDTLTKAFSGQDPKALNSVMSDLRKNTAEGSYLKAILYGRLGLTELAREEQQKLGAGSKIGQSMIEGKQYTVEYGGNGDVKRAWDANGVKVGDEGLAKISAGGMKPGTHAFGFTGERAVVPAGQKGAGEEVVPYTNSITGQVGYKYATGPFKNEEYSGSTPMAKRVDTNSQIALNDAMIKFQTAPTTAMATEMLKLAGQVDSGDGRTINGVMSRIQQLSPSIFNQVKGAAPTLQPQAQVQPQAQIQPNPQQQVQPQAQTNVTPTMGGGGSLTTQKAQQEAAVQINKELVVAEKKPPAEAKGKNEAKDIKNQYYANETYGLIKPLADEIKKSTGSGIGTSVDALAGKFGVGTTGAQSIAKLDVLGYQLSSNVPRFEGSQSDADVRLYQQAAGDLANSTKPISVRLAALQAITQVLKKYDKEGKNDWTFGEGQSANKTSSGNTFKKVQ